MTRHRTDAERAGICANGGRTKALGLALCAGFETVPRMIEVGASTETREKMTARTAVNDGLLARVETRSVQLRFADGSAMRAALTRYFFDCPETTKPFGARKDEVLALSDRRGGRESTEAQ